MYEFWTDQQRVYPRGWNYDLVWNGIVYARPPCDRWKDDEPSTRCASKSQSSTDKKRTHMKDEPSARYDFSSAPQFFHTPRFTYDVLPTTVMRIIIKPFGLSRRLAMKRTSFRHKLWQTSKDQRRSVGVMCTCSHGICFRIGGEKFSQVYYLKALWTWVFFRFFSFRLFFFFRPFVHNTLKQNIDMK